MAHGLSKREKIEHQQWIGPVILIAISFFIALVLFAIWLRNQIVCRISIDPNPHSSVADPSIDWKKSGKKSISFASLSSGSSSLISNRSTKGNQQSTPSTENSKVVVPQPPEEELTERKTNSINNNNDGEFPLFPILCGGQRENPKALSSGQQQIPLFFKTPVGGAEQTIWFPWQSESLVCMLHCIHWELFLQVFRPGREPLPPNSIVFTWGRIATQVKSSLNQNREESKNATTPETLIYSWQIMIRVSPDQPEEPNGQQKINIFQFDLIPQFIGTTLVESTTKKIMWRVRFNREHRNPISTFFPPPSYLNDHLNVSLDENDPWENTLIVSSAILDSFSTQLSHRLKNQQWILYDRHLKKEIELHQDLLLCHGMAKKTFFSLKQSVTDAYEFLFQSRLDGHGNPESFSSLPSSHIPSQMILRVDSGWILPKGKIGSYFVLHPQSPQQWSSSVAGILTISLTAFHLPHRKQNVDAKLASFIHSNNPKTITMVDSEKQNNENSPCTAYCRYIILHELIHAVFPPENESRLGHHSSFHRLADYLGLPKEFQK